MSRIQNSHVHMLAEAESKDALARGMQGFEISAAKQLNRAMGRKRGKVFASLPSLQLRDVIGGGWNDYQIDGDIPAAATDGVRRYFVLDHGEAAELAVGGLSDVTRYAVPVAPTAVAPDASDPWAAWIVTAGALRHVDQSAVGEPLLRDIGARLIRWYP